MAPYQAIEICQRITAVDFGRIFFDPSELPVADNTSLFSPISTSCKSPAIHFQTLRGKSILNEFSQKADRSHFGNTTADDAQPIADGREGIQCSVGKRSGKHNSSSLPTDAPEGNPERIPVWTPERLSARASVFNLRKPQTSTGLERVMVIAHV